MNNQFLFWGGETINSDDDSGDTQQEFGQQEF
jgi:hypothetical protein